MAYHYLVTVKVSVDGKATKRAVRNYFHRFFPILRFRGVLDSVRGVNKVYPISNIRVVRIDME